MESDGNTKRILALREKIRKGVLDQTIGEMKKETGTENAVDMFKILFDQGFRCYNTEEGAMLSMLSTLTHMIQSGDVVNDSLTLVQTIGMYGRDTVANRALLVAGCTPDFETDYLKEVMTNWMQSKELERTKELTEEVALLRSQLKKSEERVKELEESAGKRADEKFREIIEKYTNLKLVGKELGGDTK